METGPGYQTSCWQLHSVQLVPKDLGSQSVRTQKSLCSLKDVEHSSSGLLSPLHTRTPASLLHLMTLKDNQATKTKQQPTNKQTKKGEREKQ